MEASLPGSQLRRRKTHQTPTTASNLLLYSSLIYTNEKQSKKSSLFGLVQLSFFPAGEASSTVITSSFLTSFSRRSWRSL